MATLAEIVKEAAADADKQFAGQTHVTQEQINAAAGAAARRVAQSAQQSLSDGLEAQIRSAMQAKPRVPKSEK